MTNLANPRESDGCPSRQRENSLDTIARLLTIDRALCNEPGTAGMLSLAAQVIGIAERMDAELLRGSNCHGTGHP